MANEISFEEFNAKYAPKQQDTEISFDDFNAKYAAEPKSRSFGEVAGDVGSQLGKGVNTIAGAIPNLLDPSSPVSKFFNDNAQYWQNDQSQITKSLEAAADARIAEAAKTGQWEAFKTAVKEYGAEPALVQKLILENIPSMIPGLAAAKGAQIATKGSVIAGTVAGAGTNSLLNAGGARQESYQDIKSTLIAQGVPEAEADAQALEKSKVAAGVGAATGALSGGSGLERGILGGAKGGFAKRAGVELGGEQLEEVAPTIATNMQLDRDMLTGVGETSAKTLIASSPGSVISGFQGNSQPVQPTPPGAAQPDIASSSNVDELISAIKSSIDVELDNQTNQDLLDEISASNNATSSNAPVDQSYVPQPDTEPRPTINIAPDVAQTPVIEQSQPTDLIQSIAVEPALQAAPRPTEGRNVQETIAGAKDTDKAILPVGYNKPTIPETQNQPIEPAPETGGAVGVVQEQVTAQEVAAVQDIPTTEKMSKAISLVGDEEFKSQVIAKMAKYRPTNEDQKAMLVEATAIEILAKGNRSLPTVNSDFTPTTSSTLSSRSTTTPASTAQAVPTTDSALSEALKPLRTEILKYKGEGKTVTGTKTIYDATDRLKAIAEDTGETSLKAQQVWFNSKRKTLEKNGDIEAAALFERIVAQLKERINTAQEPAPVKIDDQVATVAAKPARETITPSEDTVIGSNAAGEKLYERLDKSRYRMRFDRKDRPYGYPDFGGDLAPAEPLIFPIGMRFDASILGLDEQNYKSQNELSIAIAETEHNLAAQGKEALEALLLEDQFDEIFGEKLTDTEINSWLSLLDSNEENDNSTTQGTTESGVTESTQSGEQDRDAEAQGKEGVEPTEAKPQSESKPLSEMTPSDLLRAAADKMDAESKPNLPTKPENLNTSEERVKESDISAEGVRDEPAAIEDFGQKIEGAKKDMAAAVSKEFDDSDIATLPLSKIWPANLSDKIEDNFVAAFTFAARSELPSKPRKPYAVKVWVEKAKALREMVSMVLSSDSMRAKAESLLNETKALEGFNAKVKLLESLDREQWGRIGNVREYPGAYRYEGENQVPSPYVAVSIDDRTQIFAGETSVSNIADKVNEKLGIEKQAARMKFEVRGRGEAYFINKAGDSEYRKLKTFTTAKEALNYRDAHYDELVAAWEDVKNRDNVKKDDVRGEENRPRTAEDWRKGKDVTVEQFSEAFGFRGGQFGNWVSQGSNAKERQWMLNNAYDAFMDLASILNIPPKAVSLDGQLGISFGARGRGKASAHFESDAQVINLTKTRGAGVLAHEWFHALDNYFQRSRNAPMGNNRESRYVTYRPEPFYVHKGRNTSVPLSKAELKRRHEIDPGSPRYNMQFWEVDKNHPQGIRPEVEERFAALVESLNDSPMTQRSLVIDKGKEDGYWSRIIERAARSFENYVIAKMSAKGFNNDYLANVVNIADFKRDEGRYPYLKEEELAPVVEAFDNLFGEIKSKETDKGTALFSKSTLAPNTHTVASATSAMLEAHTGKIKSVLQAMLDNGKAKVVTAEQAAGIVGEDAMSSDAQAFYNPADKVTYFVADQIPIAYTAQEFKGLVLHEIAVHAKELGKDSKEFKSILAQVDMMRKAGNKAITAAFERVPKDTKADNVTEEALAYLLQEAPSLGISQRVIAWFRNAIRAIGKSFPTLQRINLHEWASKLSPEDLRFMAESALKNADPSGVQNESDTPQFSKSSQTDTPAFKKWFGGSKVVNADGTPMVVYHGSDNDISTFDPSMLGRNTNANSARKAFFFAGHPRTTYAYMEQGVSGTDGVLRAVYGVDSKVFSKLNDKFAKEHDIPRWSVDNYSGSEEYENFMRKESSVYDDLIKTKERIQELKKKQGGMLRHTALSDSDANELALLEEKNKENNALLQMAQNSSVGDLSDASTEEADAYIEQQLGWKKAGANISPVYLAMKNPLIHDDENRGYRDVSYADLLLEAEKNGNDGIIIKNTKDGFHDSDTIYAVFDPSQIKSAIGNNGDFSQSNNNILFSKNTNPITHPFQPENSGKPLDSWIKIFTRNQIVTLYRDSLIGKKLEEYKELRERVTADTNKLFEKADNFLLELRQIPKGLRDAFASLAHDSTLNNVDPSNPKYVPSPDAVKLADYLADNPTNQTLAAKIKKRLNSMEAAHKKLHAEFSALPTKEQELFKELRSKYTEQMTMVFDEFKNRIGRMKNIDPAIKASSVKKLDEQLADLLGRVYFPLYRAGNYIVKAEKAGEPTTVDHVESNFAADRLEKKLKKLGYTVSRSTRIVSPQDNKSGEALNAVRDLLDKAALKGKIEGAALSQLMDDIDQTILQSLPDQSYRKSFIHRKGTKGYSDDFIRAYADAMRRGSINIANLRHGDKITTVIEDMRKDVKDASKVPGSNVQALNQVVDRVEQIEVDIRNPTSKLVSVSGKIAFAQMLGSLSNFILNITQTPLLTMPHLGAEYGYGKANLQLAMAYAKQMRSLKKQGTLSELGKWLDMRHGLVGNELDLMQQLHDSGFLDLTQSFDLIDAANNPSYQENELSMNFMKVIALPQHVSEIVNRQVTALATIRLEMARSGSPLKAYHAARKAIDQTHFNYSKENRAKLMTGNTQSILFRFKQYAQQAAFLFVHTAKLALDGSTKLDSDGNKLDGTRPSERTKARKQLAGVLGMQILVAGTLGLPVFAEAAVAASGVAGFKLAGSTGAYVGVAGAMIIAAALAFGDDDGEEFDVEVKKWFIKHFGEGIGSSLADGIIPRGLASRLNASELVIRRPKEARNSTDFANQWMISLLGAFWGGTVYNAGVGLKDIVEGDTAKGATKLIPVKAIKDLVTSWKWANDGMNVTNKDGEIITPVSKADIFFKSIGINPTSVVNAREYDNAKFTLHNALLKKQQKALKELREETDKTKRFNAIIKYNKSAPLGYEIDSDKVRGVIAREIKYNGKPNVVTGNPVQEDYLNKNTKELRPAY